MRLPIVLLISSLLLAAAPAKAADEGFYLGVGAGQFNTEVDDVWGSGYTFDEGHFGYKVFGGYKFFPWLSVEGAYINGGEPDVEATSGPETARLAIDVHSLVAAAVFTLPLGDQFELFAKPGFAYWESSTSFSYTDSSFQPPLSGKSSSDDSGSAFFLGAGVGFNAGNAGLRFEYEWFDVAPEYDDASDEFVDELDATGGFLSLSIVYMFEP